MNAFLWRFTATGTRPRRAVSSRGQGRYLPGIEVRKIACLTGRCGQMHFQWHLPTTNARRGSSASSRGEGRDRCGTTCMKTVPRVSNNWDLPRDQSLAHVQLSRTLARTPIPRPSCLCLDPPKGSGNRLSFRAGFRPLVLLADTVRINRSVSSPYRVGT